MSDSMQQCLFCDLDMSGRTQRKLNAHTLAMTEELGTLFPNVRRSKIAEEIAGALMDLVRDMRDEQIANDSADRFVDSIAEMVRKVGGA